MLTAANVPLTTGMTILRSAGNGPGASTRWSRARARFADEGAGIRRTAITGIVLIGVSFLAGRALRWFGPYQGQSSVLLTDRLHPKGDPRFHVVAVRVPGEVLFAVQYWDALRVIVKEKGGKERMVYLTGYNMRTSYPQPSRDKISIETLEEFRKADWSDMSRWILRLGG
ncbi:hypothetical protein LCGC14_2138630 [marine sediment metagenome]|uniref:Uncharacterized protein n=1 Tax=marine sediment metagenome TaxID=412755 RepID=A0A0F9DZA5_9ZZZZ